MVWQLLGTATGRVEEDGRIDGVAFTDTANGRVEQDGHTDGVTATWYGYWPCRTGRPY